VEVPHLLARQQPADRGVHLAVHDALAGDDPAVGAVGFEGQRQIAELRREPLVFIGRAVVPVDEDGAGGGIGVQSPERIVGEEDPVLLAFAELLQAEAAGAVAGGDLDVGGVAVAGRFQGRPDFPGESLGGSRRPYRWGQRDSWVLLCGSGEPYAVA